MRRIAKMYPYRLPKKENDGKYIDGEGIKTKAKASNL